MKNRILTSAIALIVIAGNAYPEQTITLSKCIDAAMKNKAGIEAARTDRMIASLQVKESASGYMPQVSAAYDYRYYAIIPTQVVPVGQFYAVPTNEMRGIKFGTPWQQNAGITLYQLLIDLSITSHLRESRINEKLRDNDLAEAEEDLKFEVVNSYLMVWLKGLKLTSAILDTVRTSKTIELLRAGYAEGRVQAYDLNKAFINHNRNLSSFSLAQTELAKEKIYLSFLTGFPLKEIIEDNFDFSPFETDSVWNIQISPQYDSIPSVRRLVLAGELSSQQARSERNSRSPSIGVDGFLGASQFDTRVSPFEQGTWHGNSYIGVSLKLPILGGTSTRNRISQLRMQAKASDLRLQDEKQRVDRELLSKQQEVYHYREQLSLTEKNIAMLKSNQDLFEERLNKGLVNVFDLLEQENDLHKEQNDLDQVRTNLLITELALIRQSGLLDEFMRKVR